MTTEATTRKPRPTVKQRMENAFMELKELQTRVDMLKSALGKEELQRIDQECQGDDFDIEMQRMLEKWGTESFVENLNASGRLSWEGKAYLLGRPLVWKNGPVLN